MQKFLMLILSLVMVACIEEPELNETAEIISSTSNSNNSESGQSLSESCEVGSYIEQSCLNEVENALVALKVSYCVENSGSTALVDTQCVIQDCSNGYVKSGNTCVAKECTAGTTEAQDCSTEINGALKASRILVCDSSGIYKEATSCQLSECQDSHYKVGNTCQEKVCIGNTTNIDCSNDIENAQTAVQLKTCTDNGSSYTLDTCSLVECKSGFAAIDNKCVPVTCTPGQKILKNCISTADNASSAFKMVQCNESGTDYEDLNSCTLNSCKAGYYVSDGACIAKTCNANESITVSCSAENAKVATKNLKCNSKGSAQTEISSCTISECNDGYKLENGKCVVDEQSEDEDSESDQEGDNSSSDGSSSEETTTTKIYAGVADLPSPSAIKMTCKSWLAENGLELNVSLVMTEEYNFTTELTSISDKGDCAYEVTLTQNGVQTTYCESKSWDNSEFQGSWELYDSIVPVHSCVSSDTNVRLQTSVLRDSSIDTEAANNFVDQPDPEEENEEEDSSNNEDSSGSSSSTSIFAGVADLPAPSANKMTCKDWLIENGISLNSSQVRSQEYNFTTGLTSIANDGNCAYKVTLTQNGTQSTYCESKGWDSTDFQGTWALYDSIEPVHSCISSNENIRIQTNVLRDASIDTAAANNFVEQTEEEDSNSSDSSNNSSNSSSTTSAFIDVSSLNIPAASELDDHVTCKFWLAANGIEISNEEHVRSQKWLSGNNYDIAVQGQCAYKIQYTADGETYCETRSWDSTDFENGLWGQLYKIEPTAFCDTQNGSTNTRYKTNIFYTTTDETEDEGSEETDPVITSGYVDLSSLNLTAASSIGSKVTCKDWLTANGVSVENSEYVRSHKWLSGNNYDIARPEECAYRIQYTSDGETFCETRSWDDEDFKNGLWEQLYKIEPATFCDTQNGSTNTRYKTTIFQSATTETDTNTNTEKTQTVIELFF